MSKKGIALLTTMVFVMLCGCKKDADITTVSQSLPASVEKEISVSTDKQGDKDANTAKEDDKLVCDRWADKGSFKVYTSEEDSFDFNFNYSVPQIVDDTDSAKEINDTIAFLFEDMHNTMQKASKEGKISAEELDSADWFQTNYECYMNGSIASIVIFSTGYFDDITKYYVYNYDFSTGEQVTNEELFALKGLSDEEFAEGIRRAAAYLADMEMMYFFESEMPLTEDELWYEDVVDDSVQHMYGGFLLAKARTIHMDNINEYLPVYLDAKGDLQAVTHRYNMSQYGEATDILSPKALVNGNLKASSGDLLDVVSKDDGIYLTIYKNEWSEEVYEEFPTFEFSKEYKIGGLYKNYKDARISWVGNGRQPYILLLADDGMISYVDVWEGIASGCFSAVEPLWGIVNIESFSEDSEYRVMAVNNKGMLIDLEEALYMMLNCKAVDFERGMLNLYNNTRYSAVVNRQGTEYEELIGFTDDMYHMFVRESYKTDSYEGGSQVGYITFNGMNEKGMVYYFSLTGEEGELRGTMAVNTYSFWDEDYFDLFEGADVTCLGGFDIFESEGNRVMLSGSVG